MKRRKNKHSVSHDIQDIRLNKSLSRWFILQTLILLGLSVFTTMIIQWPIVLTTKNGEIDTLRLAAIILGWICVLGFFELIQYRFTKTHLEKVCDMIERLARGDYGHKLNITRFNVFKSISNDMNLLSEELKNVQMLRNDFVNSYSHEFKTPIASINGFAQLLLTDDTLDEKTKKQYLQIIADESDRLTALAENTILLSQLDNQKILTDRKTYSLDEQLRRCVIMLSKQWGTKSITVSGEKIEEIDYYGNEDLMQHLWLNLLNNAIKFTPENGTISISAKKANGKIVVSVSDTGIGMSPESTRHVFDKYFREKNCHNVQGLGLGLSIAEKIINLSGGRISVESQLGKGSTFIVEL